MKPRLLLLSDLWGRGQSDWWQRYSVALSPHFQLQWYDCCELANLQLVPYEQDVLHQQFVQGGIERAAAKLLQEEAHYPTSRQILSFSMGGVIAWKAIQAGLPVHQYYAVSASRLRYEQVALPAHGCLWYGDQDAFRPSPEWLGRQHLRHHLLPAHGHECYREPQVVKLITDTLIASQND